MIPAGLEAGDERVETFVNEDGSVRIIHDGSCTDIDSTHEHVVDDLVLIVKKDKIGYSSLVDYFKITDPAEQLQKYIRCTSPIINGVPDIDGNGRFNKEIWDCPDRATCKAFGRICKPIEGPMGTLTKKETTIFFLTCKGLLDKEIASMLGNSINTVDVWQRSIRAKLHLNNRVECIVFANRQGISI